MRDAMLFNVNYFAADEGKSLICRVFIETDMILFCVYTEFRIIYFRIFSNDFLHSFLYNLFYIKVLRYKM